MRYGTDISKRGDSSTGPLRPITENSAVSSVNPEIQILKTRNSNFKTGIFNASKSGIENFGFSSICPRHVCPVCLRVEESLSFPSPPPRLPLRRCAPLYYLGLYITNVGRVHNNTHVRRRCAFPGVQVRVRSRAG